MKKRKKNLYDQYHGGKAHTYERIIGWLQGEGFFFGEQGVYTVWGEFSGVRLGNVGSGWIRRF